MQKRRRTRGRWTLICTTRCPGSAVQKDPAGGKVPFATGGRARGPGTEGVMELGHHFPLSGDMGGPACVKPRCPSRRPRTTGSGEGQANWGSRQLCPEALVTSMGRTLVPLWLRDPDGTVHSPGVIPRQRDV